MGKPNDGSFLKRFLPLNMVVTILRVETDYTLSVKKTMSIDWQVSTCILYRLYSRPYASH